MDVLTGNEQRKSETNVYKLHVGDRWAEEKEMVSNK